MGTSGCHIFVKNEETWVGTLWSDKQYYLAPLQSDERDYKAMHRDVLKSDNRLLHTTIHRKIYYTKCA